MYAPDAASFVVYESDERTVAPDAETFTNSKYRGAHIILDIDDIPGASPSLSVNVYAVPPIGDPYLLLQGSAHDSEGRKVYKIGPNLNEDAGDVADDALPVRWQVEVVHANTDPVTYSLCVLMLAGA